MMRLTAIAFLVVLAFVAVVFSGNRHNEFSRLDDFDYVCRNQHIREGVTAESVKWAFTDAGYAANWHPLTWISHAADISVARLRGWDWLGVPDKNGKRTAKVTGHLSQFVHAENVAWHAANAALLFVFLVMLLGRLGLLGEGGKSGIYAAAFCAILWAVHPLRVEVVAWVAERKELLSVFFMLLSLIVYLPTIAGRGIRAAVWFGLSLLFFALALLAKPVAVGLPAVMFGLEVLLMRKGATRRDWVIAIARVVPFALLALGTVILTMVAQNIALKQGDEFSPFIKMVCAVEAPAIYLRQTFWPFGLSLSYMMPTAIDPPHFAAGVLIVIAMLAGGIRWLWAAIRGKAEALGWRLVPFAIAWCYICLVPMLGIVKVGYQPHSDRYTYWVGCGVAALLAIGLAKFEPLWRPFAKRMAIGGAVLLVVLTLVSLNRSSYWRRSLTLFADAVEKAHNESDALVLSELMIKEFPEDHGKMAEAMLREVLSIRKTPYARAVLAHTLAICGDPQHRIDPATGKEEAFEEVKMLAYHSFEENANCRADVALAAMGFAEYRLHHYRKAYDYLKQALDAGYEPFVVDLDMDELKQKADAEPEEGKDKE